MSPSQSRIVWWIAGALVVLFSVEQIVNGWLHGFEGPEDADDFAGIIK